MKNATLKEWACSVKTVLVEPSELFREGLKHILAETVYGSAIFGESFDEIQPLLNARSGVSLLIADAAQDFAATCERIRSLKKQIPTIRVVMLVERYDFNQMLAAIEAGAAAYLVKSTSPEALVKTLDLVMLGEMIFPVTIFPRLREMAAVPQAGKVKGLTERETAVLECLTQGESNKEIARRLEISEGTVKVHIKAILRKLQVKNRTQAAMWASTHAVD
ncbi:response regulator transcription factor [Microvirga solisilvae]|uniref:response regulator transcription factor n=1 Tax=Microvirga solisilvae TaxID=2919498 RepID=UPI001FAED9A3|nr:response regulator transcription factor [Microvirga solisilvae]